MNELYNTLLKALSQPPKSSCVSESQMIMRVVVKTDRPKLDAMLHQLRKSGKYNNVKAQWFGDVLMVAKQS